MTKKRLSKEDRRQQIIDSALPIFARYGVDGTTTKMLAKAAKISEPVLYQHFKSKEDLYASLETFCVNNVHLGISILGNIPDGVKRLIYGIHFFARTVLWAVPTKGSAADCLETQNVTRLYLHSLISDAKMAKGNVETVEPLVKFLLQAWRVAAKQNCLCEGQQIYEEDLWLAFQMVIGVSAYGLPNPPIVPGRTFQNKLVRKTTVMLLRSLGVKNECIEKNYSSSIDKELIKLIGDHHNNLD